MRKDKNFARRVFAFLLSAVLLMSAFVALPASALTDEDVFATAEWKVGTYTNSSATGRRHAVIPCELGERFYFSFDSEWRLTLQFMGADGTLVPRDVYLSAAKVWTVQTMDGITPAYMIVTVRNSANSTISDEQWATFAVTCYRKEAVAPNKNLANLFITSGREGDAYTFSCFENDTFFFDFTDDSYSLAVEFLEDETVLDEMTVFADGNLVIGEIDGKIPTDIRVTVSPTAGGAMTEDLWDAFDVVCRQESDHITVATMNYGAWNMGVSQGIADDKAAAQLVKWNNLMGKVGVDILCGQEWCENYNKSGTISSSESIFAAAFPYHYGSSLKNGKNTASKYEVSDYSMESFGSISPERDYTVGYVTVNGKKVCIINTHNSIGKTEEGIAQRRSEFEHLISLMKKEEYVILCGDFNTETTAAEWLPFTAAGYKMANCGDFGPFVTCSTTYCIDNIIVSPNIELKSVRMMTDAVSDHRMLVADLKLLDEDEIEVKPTSCEHQDKGWEPHMAQIDFSDLKQDTDIEDYINKGLADVGLTVDDKDIGLWSYRQEDGRTFIGIDTVSSNGLSFKDVSGTKVGGRVMDLSFDVRFREAMTTSSYSSVVRVSADDQVSDTTTLSNPIMFRSAAQVPALATDPIGYLSYGTAHNVESYKGGSEIAVYANVWYNIRLVYDAVAGTGGVVVTDENGLQKSYAFRCNSLSAVYQIVLSRGYSKVGTTCDIDDICLDLTEEFPTVDTTFDFSTSFVPGSSSVTMTQTSIIETEDGAKASSTTLTTRQTDKYDYHEDGYLSVSNSGSTTNIFVLKNDDVQLQDIELSFDYYHDSSTTSVSGMTPWVIDSADNNDGVKNEARRPISISGNTLCFGGPTGGRKTNYQLASIPNDKWVTITLKIHRADDTYVILVDGVMVAYTTLTDGVYKIHYTENDFLGTEFNASGIHTERPMYVGAEAGAFVSATFMRYGYGGAFLADNARLRVLPTNWQNEYLGLPMIREDVTHLYTPDFQTVGYTCEKCLWGNGHDGLYALEHKGVVDASNGTFIKDDTGSAVRLALNGSNFSYLGKDTVWLESELMVYSGTGVLTVASVERFNSEGDSVVLPLLAVDSSIESDNLSFCGELTKTFALSTKHTVRIGFNTERAMLYVDGAKLGEVSLAGKMDIATAESVSGHIALTSTAKYCEMPVNMDTLVVLSTDTANFMAYSLTVSHELISMCGVQAATNTNRVRVLAGIQSLAYSAVGFEVERWNGNNNTWTSLDGYETDAVFTSVSAAGVPVTAAEEGYEYLSAFVVEDIDSSGVLRFTPYVVKNGSKMRGSSVIYSVQACYKNEDGVYADYESQASTVMTSKPDYNTVVVQTDLEMPDFDGYSVLNISSPFDGSFENASTILSEYSNSNYSTIINRKALFRYGGQASFTALKKTSGSKYRQPLTGEKALAFENISGQNSSTSGLDGKVKISNMLPDDACTEQNLGKTYKIAFYVYVDNLRTWVTSSSPYTHQPYSGDTVDVMVGLLDDTSTAALCTTKTVTLTRGKWNLVEYEFTVSKDILETLGTKAFSSSDATEVKVPARPFVSFGTPAVFAGDFYIDNMMVGWK